MLVFDVNDMESFKYCLKIGVNLKKSKKVIYVANKFDNIDLERNKVILEARMSCRHMVMNVSTKTTLGLN